MDIVCVYPTLGCEGFRDFVELLSGAGGQAKKNPPNFLRNTKKNFWGNFTKKCYKGFLEWTLERFPIRTSEGHKQVLKDLQKKISGGLPYHNELFEDSQKKKSRRASRGNLKWNFRKKNLEDSQNILAVFSKCTPVKQSKGTPGDFQKKSWRISKRNFWIIRNPPGEIPKTILEGI